MPTDKTIFLLRHGETQYNKLGKYQGTLDSPLTENGIAQMKSNAFLLQRKLSASDKDEAAKFYSSPLGRAKQSAEIIKENLTNMNLKIMFNHDLQEVDLGSWNGKNLQEVSQGEIGIDPFNWYFRSPDGESYDTVIKRCENWVHTLEQVEEKTIIVMSHGLLGRVLRGYLLGLDYKEAIYLDVPQRGFFEIRNQKISFVTDNYEAF